MKCPKCNYFQTISKDIKGNERKRYCIKCQYIFYTNEIISDRIYKPLINRKMKFLNKDSKLLCTKCKEYKLVKDFYCLSNVRYSSHCKSCQNKRDRKNKLKKKSAG